MKAIFAAALAVGVIFGCGGQAPSVLTANGWGGICTNKRGPVVGKLVGSPGHGKQQAQSLAKMKKKELEATCECGVYASSIDCDSVSDWVPGPPQLEVKPTAAGWFCNVNVYCMLKSSRFSGGGTLPGGGSGGGGGSFQ